MKRRHFLHSAGLSLPALAIARDPIARSGPANLHLGLAAYSFRPLYKWMKGKAQDVTEGSPMTLTDFVDYCADNHIPGAEITTYFFEPSVTDEAILKLRLHAQNRGVALSGTAIGNNFSIGKGAALDKQIADAKSWIDKTALLGSSHVRFFAGKKNEFDADPARMGIAIDALQECADYASKKGVVVGVENHGNLNVDEMLHILKKVDSPWIGMNLDTSNYVVESEAELVDAVKRSLPYAVNVQVKVKRKIGDGSKVDVDIEKMVGLIKESGYQGYVVMEYEEEDPLKNVPIEVEKLRGYLKG